MARLRPAGDGLGTAGSAPARRALLRRLGCAATGEGRDRLYPERGSQGRRRDSNPTFGFLPACMPLHHTDGSSLTHGIDRVKRPLRKIVSTMLALLGLSPERVEALWLSLSGEHIRTGYLAGIERVTLVA